MTMEPIRTCRLILRTPDQGDADRIVALLGDYQVSAMLARVPHPYTRADARDWLADLGNGTDHRELAFAIDDGSGLVGVVAFRDLPNNPVIGYWLGRAYWGRGYMSEAVEAAIDWLYRKTGHDTVKADVMNENPASLKVLRKLGFTELGSSSCASLARGESRPAIRAELKRDDFLKTRTAC